MITCVCATSRDACKVACKQINVDQRVNVIMRSTGQGGGGVLKLVIANLLELVKIYSFIKRSF